MTASQIIVVVVALVVVAAIVYLVYRQQRTKSLKGRFGPEYDRAVDSYGDRGRAESVLTKREKRVEKLDIHPLTAQESSRFAAEWKTVQMRFVDDPAAAIGDADRLVAQVMGARGYPMVDFEQRAADISVSHPEVVEHYRVAHEIAQKHRQRPVSTEELRKAFLHYRQLFGTLLEVAPAERDRAVADEPDTRAEARR
jgi:hypothetical protein